MRRRTRDVLTGIVVAVLLAMTMVAAAACGDDSSKGTRDDPFPYEKSRSGFGWG
ncbi:MAG: hypothetical protein OXO54_12615 [Chloroflexota bacterium]|nr:hypothetical protein [Rhodospirillaceae bacterium]MDE2769037.1 hypothetical protein [Chloroflexota bacterium]MDE2899153.1 hypothetical protein [Chloroflexota bacterium]